MANTHEEGVKIYEIGYLFVSSIPKEKVAAETAALKSVLAKAGATVIGSEDPELITLAYQMKKKMNGIYQRFDEAYFGWVKFELTADAIESVKKTLDATENVLRHLLVTTTKENIYLGKRAPTFTVAARDAGMIAPEGAAPAADAVIEKTVDGVVIAASSVEDMDKSIDAMVKGA